MAQPTNTFDTYDAIGVREDLSDMIYNISPTDTWFMSTAGRGKVSNILTEWQTDALAAVDTANAVIEGDDATLDAVTATARVTNRTQISDKTVVISGTEEVVDKAGRDSELSYQITKKMAELKRDMEAIITQNQAVVVGDATTARKLRSLESWYTTNTSRGATGANGSATTAATDGTQRDITETLLKSVIQQCYTAGGNPKYLLVGPVNKQKVSGFTGGATKMIDAEDAKLVAAVDVYRSDFGEIRVVPSRFARERTAHLLDMEYWSIGFLRTFRAFKLSKTGDSEKWQALAEYTLLAKNQGASGVIADLTTT